VERPDELLSESPAAESQPQVASAPAAKQPDATTESANWFEQPYPDPDEDLFPETNNNAKQQ
jgi:hypothetical protein